jgi:hypothetical protein
MGVGHLISRILTVPDARVPGASPSAIRWAPLPRTSRHRGASTPHTSVNTPKHTLTARRCPSTQHVRASYLSEVVQQICHPEALGYTLSPRCPSLRDLPDYRPGYLRTGGLGSTMTTSLAITSRCARIGITDPASTPSGNPNRRMERGGAQSASDGQSPSAATCRRNSSSGRGGWGQGHVHGHVEGVGCGEGVGVAQMTPLPVDVILEASFRGERCRHRIYAGLPISRDRELSGRSYGLSCAASQAVRCLPHLLHDLSIALPRLGIRSLLKP